MGYKVSPTRDVFPSNEPTIYTESKNLTKAVILSPHNTLPVGQISPLVVEGLTQESEQMPPVQRAPQPQPDISPPVYPMASEPLTPTLPTPNPSDKSWNLLQTIFRKHQEKKAAAETGPIQRVDPPAGPDSKPPLNPNTGTTLTPLQATKSPGLSNRPGMESTPPSSDSTGGSHPPGTDSVESGSPQMEGDAAMGGGTMTGGGSATTGGNALVGGHATVGGSATIGGNAAAGENVAAGKNLNTGANLELGGNTRARANIAAGVANVSDNLQAGTDINAGAAKIDGGLTVGSNLSPGSPIKTGGDIRGSQLESQGSTTLSKNIVSGGKFQAARDVDAGGSAAQSGAKGSHTVDIGGNATLGPSLQAGSELDIGGSAQVGSTAKSGGEPSAGGLTSGENASVGGSTVGGGPVTAEGTSNVSPGEVSGSNRGAVQPKPLEDSLPPLQDAWPVQRKPGPLPEAPIVMQKAIPGQVSDSDIEIIPPRRPRPLDAPTLTQRAPNLQLETKPQVPGDHSMDPDPIPTEIGPLPQDLWRLIGQKPPQQGSAASSKTDQIVSRKPEKPRTPPKVETIQPEPGDSPQNGDSILEVPTPLIQRTALGSEASSQESGSEEAPPELDTDELARKVYAEIKRRLTTEWERFRHLV